MKNRHFYIKKPQLISVWNRSKYISIFLPINTILPKHVVPVEHRNSLLAEVLEYGMGSSEVKARVSMHPFHNGLRAPIPAS